MKTVSVFNNVLGPVMRGPSSSHTAASYHIGRMARDILGAEPRTARISFDANGSYGKVFREQGSDKAFVSGLMDWDLLDDVFHDALRVAEAQGCDFRFDVAAFPEANHPNWVRLVLTAAGGETATVEAASIGGGSVVVSRIDDFATDLRGDRWVAFAACGADTADDALAMLKQRHPHGNVEIAASRDRRLLLVAGGEKPGTAAAGLSFHTVRPVFFPVKGKPLFRSAAELATYAETKHLSVGDAALDYECALLGISREEAMAEMRRRYDIMKSACNRALSGQLATSMQLLRPTAQKSWEQGQAGRLPFWGLHSRAAIRAMAVMHANGGMDVVCAAPTGGSAGALPGAVITLEEECGLSADETCMALFAAAAIGIVLDTRATFAAEVAGCQVEIGAGGAMASAACVEASGGSVRQALDAAAVSFQNSMGSICDPVQGMVEIPCHTRNASAAAGAFVNADIVLGGYVNDIPLDETIDAVYAVGKMLPPELRCTSLGGLSVCPSALAMKRLR